MIPPSRRAPVRALWALAAATGASLGLAGTAGAGPAAPSAQLTATVTPTELTLGAAAGVTGTWTGPGPAGTTLAMRVQPYPYTSTGTVVSSSLTGPDGAFAFPPLHPDRNTRLQVFLASAGAAEGAIVKLQIYVDPRASVTAVSLGPGRAQLSLRIRHAVVPGAGDGTVRWFLAAGGSNVFHLAAQTPASELRPGLLSATTIVDPPARRFAFRACVNPSWERAMGPPSAHRPCPAAGFVLPAADAG